MEPTKIGKAYDQITHLWESDKLNRENGIAQHKRAISFVQHKGKALDVGCGCTGRFTDLLLDQGFTPEGVDISARMIELARARHQEMLFHHADICKWEPLDTYDLISAWDSIWHIPLNQQRPVLTKLIKALNPGGVFIFSFGGTDQESEHTDDFMGPEVYYSTLGISGFLRLFEELGCNIKHLQYDQYPELHTYLIVQKPS